MHIGQNYNRVMALHAHRCNRLLQDLPIHPLLRGPFPLARTHE
jgi:hypothetical protein